MFEVRNERLRSFEIVITLTILGILVGVTPFRP